MEKAFGRYRLMSFVTGTTLIILTFFIVLHGFGFTLRLPGSTLHVNVPGLDISLWKHLRVLVAIFGISHGVVLYPIYMVLCFQLALKARLHIGFVALMLLAGFVPGLAFYMEHKMERRLFPNGYSRQ